MLNGKQGQELLENLVKIWESFAIYSKMMDKIFDYLNRYYLKNSELKMVGETCIHMFHEQVFTRERKQLITSTILG